MMEDDSFEYYEEQYFNSSQDELEDRLPNLNINVLSQLQPLKEQSKPQVQMKKQNENETPAQYFEFNQENVACKICYKYAINGVLCKNQKCSILFCGACAKEAVKKIDNKCPFCRISPFQYAQSPYKSIINKMQLVCQLCQQKYILQDEQSHYKKRCEHFKKTKCQFCQQTMPHEQIVKHTRLQHQDKFDEIIQRMYGCFQPNYDPNELLSKNQVYLNKINRVPHLGTTGKFYCGSRLEGPKCHCCNGYCGPSNGQNCVQCMKLDIKRLGLKKGYLLNSSGNVCWRKGDEFICGVMIYYQSANCREGHPCKSCRNMKTNIKRYIDLL